MLSYKDILLDVKNALYPADCALCGTALLDAAEYAHGICVLCVHSLEVDWADRCAACGRPLISEKNTCMECREKPKPSYDAALALYPYAGRYQNLLSSYKFGTHRNVAVFFAERLAQARQRHSHLFQNADAWVPVPPKQGKIKHKGWDQVDLIAHRLYRIERSGMQYRGTALPSIPIVRCLKRSASRSQKELDRSQRAINLKGKIRCVGKPPARILLFDDVITTGATLEACARELKEKGAETVYALALFYD